MSPIDSPGLRVGLLAFWLLGGLVARLGSLLLVLAGSANLTLDPRVEASLLKSRWPACLLSLAPVWLDPARN